MDNKTIDIISICVNAFFSLTALFLSTVVFLRSRQDNKQNLELALYTNVQQAKSNIDNAMFSYLAGNPNDKSDDEANNMSLAIKSLIENYLNAINVSCLFFLDGNVSEDRFILMYKSDINTVFGDYVYEDVRKASDYDALQKVYHIVNISK